MPPGEGAGAPASAYELVAQLRGVLAHLLRVARSGGHHIARAVHLRRDLRRHIAPLERQLGGELLETRLERGERRDARVVQLARPGARARRRLLPRDVRDGLRDPLRLGARRHVRHTALPHAPQV